MRHNNLTTAAKQAGLTPVKGVLRTFFGSFPRLEEGDDRTVSVIARANPSPRVSGNYFFTVDVNAQRSYEMHGIPGDLERAVTTARLAYEGGLPLRPQVGVNVKKGDHEAVPYSSQSYLPPPGPLCPRKEEIMTDDIREMIARAKASLAEEQKADILGATTGPTVKPGYVEPANKEGALAIAKELAILSAQADAIEERRKALTNALKVLGGTAEGLRIGDMPLANLVRSHPVRLNTKVIQERFPYDDYPQLYQLPREEVRLVLSPAVKDLVRQEAEQGQVEP